jgi:hypothetical protein
MTGSDISAATINWCQSTTAAKFMLEMRMAHCFCVFPLLLLLLLLFVLGSNHQGNWNWRMWTNLPAVRNKNKIKSIDHDASARTEILSPGSKRRSEGSKILPLLLLLILLLRRLFRFHVFVCDVSGSHAQWIHSPNQFRSVMFKQQAFWFKVFKNVYNISWGLGPARSVLRRIAYDHFVKFD